MVIVYLLIAVAIAVLDQAVKYWTVANIALGGIIPVWDGIFHLTYIKNTGAAFSMLSDHTWLLTGISCFCIVLIIVMLLMKKVSKAEKWALTFILGGAVGNVIDRIKLQYVVDMFEVEFMEFAVFNVADIFITCAGIAFAIVFLVESVKEEKELKKMKNSRMKELDRLKKAMEAADKNEGDSADDSDKGGDNGEKA